MQASRGWTWSPGKGIYQPHQHVVTLLYLEYGLSMRASLIINITDLAGVLAGVLFKLQMLKQGHMGLVFIAQIKQ